ncbi:glycosyltransferase family 2 protein [Salmonella enterica]|nr:glycosyltransferase family 2 protein [Salmonella enterica]HCM1885242.1 glycosyltransferase family 2 protein [Salmonella enterica subsp. salamae serovar 60:z10:z39]EFS7614830.1 glycosyltransferase family 2 protein [Salmonella enterica]EGR7265089.1 glycosyltransferase family 2 protein [Salmonella enterica]EGT8583044.1 glycosyltransferase family 2 protein [Salmonella enterica]
MNNNLVSIITPIYNSAIWVGNLIKNVKEQTYQHWELIIIDDCSNDNTFEVLSHAAEKDKRIRLYKNKSNQGPGSTRNLAIELAKGRFIAFLDADDEWDKDKLKIQISIMIEKRYFMSYHDYRHMSCDGKMVGDVVRGPEILDWNIHHYRRGVGCLTIMFDRTLGELPFFPSIKNIIAEDFLAWSNILKKGHCGYRIPYDLARYRLSDTGRSSNKIKAIKSVWFIYRSIEKIPILYCIFFWVQYCINSFMLHRRARPYLTIEK